MVWFSILERGNHGMIDSFQYRKTMTDFIFFGDVPEEDQSEEARVETAKELMGKPAPDTAVESAKALRERLLLNKMKQQKT